VYHRRERKERGEKFYNVLSLLSFKIDIQF